ncbi:hypothetical protein SmJEL517_g06197 [Synchytrium microbalum]|uniref:Probable lysosomal cobalamin transporter n=1 Tax=Synchytrium microbalum TaxID=1806994 RepID=A0A507BSR5_9FUNG|nr:uncharacterized protein SmJEL517_g06197 [Synchytrium microbalum]TPX30179.1 hypothetical protein SmJEL517_g06197 [Synchytrium microbalum]
MDLSTGLKFDWATPETIASMVSGIRSAYFVFYGLVALLAFVLLPFAYFYYEEWEEEDSTFAKRGLGALKYTSFTIVLFFVLLMTGLLLKSRTTDERTDIDWFKKLLTASGAEKALMFVMAALILLGMLIYISYTAYGLAALPFSYLKGTQTADTQKGNIEGRLSEIREQIRAINGRYINTNRKITKRDTKLLSDLNLQERQLTRRIRRVETESQTFWYRFASFFRPLEVIIGIVLLLLTGLLMVSLLLASIDKVANSICGSDCGFVLKNPQIYNPLNGILVATSPYFPVDYILFIAVMSYFLFSTLFGVMKIGIRMLWVHLYDIKLGETAPQGLLLTTLLLMLSVLPLNYFTLVVAPGYASFGSQKFCNATITCLNNPELIVPCSIDSPSELCTPTVVSTLLGLITYSNPFFGTVYYIAQWVFLVMVVFSFFIAGFRSAPPPARLNAEDDDDTLSPTDERRPLIDDEERRPYSAVARAGANGGTSHASTGGYRG